MGHTWATEGTRHTLINQQITSFSALFRELRVQSNFIACGEELLPLEITKKRQAPSSNSSSDSTNDMRSRKKKPPRKRDEMGMLVVLKFRTLLL